MTHHLGKTSTDRLRYVGEWNAKKLKEQFSRMPVVGRSDMGVTVTPEYDIHSTLKQRIRDCAADRRTHRTAENHALMDALCLEAHEKGWSPSDIARAAMCPISQIRTRLARVSPR